MSNEIMRHLHEMDLNKAAEAIIKCRSIIQVDGFYTINQIENFDVIDTVEKALRILCDVKY